MITIMIMITITITNNYDDDNNNDMIIIIIMHAKIILCNILIYIYNNTIIVKQHKVEQY